VSPLSRVAYESGRGKSSVLFLHGLTGTPHEVLPLAQSLRDRYHVLVPWLPGHGETPSALARTTWRDWAKAALDAFDRLARRRCPVHVAGLSMGACLALYVALERPARSVISMSAPLFLRDPRFQGIRFFRFLQWRTRELAGGVLDTGLVHQTYPTCPTKSLYELKQLGDEVTRRLTSLSAPLLVLQGRYDRMVPSSSAERLLERAGSAHKFLRWMEDSGHVLPLDRDRDLVGRVVRRFIGRQGRSC